MEELKALLRENNESLEMVAGDLESLRVEVSKLPETYLKRDEALEKESRLQKLIAAGAVVLVVVAGVLGTTLYLNHGVTCGVRGILVSARTASTRNPLPPDLTDEQREMALAQREQARQFFETNLDHLNIIWPCSGEQTP